MGWADRLARLYSVHRRLLLILRANVLSSTRSRGCLAQAPDSDRDGHPGNQQGFGGRVGIDQTPISMRRVRPAGTATWISTSGLVTPAAFSPRMSSTADPAGDQR